MDTNAPEEKPYRMQKTIIGAFEDEGSQRPSTMMAEKPVVIIMTLKRPILSAAMPGRIRPKMLANR